jgi:hypothetical protein
VASARLTIFLSGMIAAILHQGGASWAVLQYLLGLKRVGHEVYFVERRKSQQVGNSLVNDACQGYGGKNLRDQASRIYVKERWEYCATALDAAKYDKLQEYWRSFYGGRCCPWLVA